jgi:hypothetical protein
VLFCTARAPTVGAPWSVSKLFFARRAHAGHGDDLAKIPHEFSLKAVAANC